MRKHPDLYRKKSGGPVGLYQSEIDDRNHEQRQIEEIRETLTRENARNRSDARRLVIVKLGIRWLLQSIPDEPVFDDIRKKLQLLLDPYFVGWSARVYEDRWKWPWQMEKEKDERRRYYQKLAAEREE